MTNAQPEPSMEEILASIRRIISEDEEENVSAQEPATRAEAPARVEPAAQEAMRDEEVEGGRFDDAPEAEIASVEIIDDEPLAEISDAAPATDAADSAGHHLETEDVEMIKRDVSGATLDDSMLGEETAAAASSAFRNLSQSIRVAAGEGRTLEDLVTDLLKPMIKQWLDTNLPAIVEEKVEEEVQRVARRRG